MKTAMRTLLLVFLLWPFMLFAQLNEDFSDGDFTSNPSWMGDESQFMVNSSQQLQLQSTGEGLSCLSTALLVEGAIEWRFWIRLNFSPSDNNNARVYILADQSDLKTPLNGYFLKFGEGGSNDAIELYRQSGTAESLICRGSESLISASFIVRIKVTRSEAGEWAVFADPAGGEDFQLQASGTETSWQAYSFFGVLCKYTSSNATRFYFDDIYAGPQLIDNIPPVLQSLEVNDQNSLTLYFSETVQEASANNVMNYTADKGLGNPLAAGRDVQQKSAVHLLFENAFQQGETYNLTTSGLMDIIGNVMESTILPFAFYNVQSHDIVINEIMADPDPPVGLPNFEYLELYNRSNYPIQLQDWVLSIGTTKKVMPKQTIQPNGYLILTSDEAAPAFTGMGDVVAFSSLSLSNTGTSLVLRKPSGVVIHTVNYTDAWYKDALKKNGGWSIEQIDVLNPCGGTANWRASISPQGGTPGAENSVEGSNPDTTIPGIEKISITGPASVRLFFTESMDSLILLNPTRYSVDQGLGSPVAIVLFPPDYRSVGLTFSQSIADGVIYTLQLEAGFADCAGNITEDLLTAKFAFPALPEAMDVIINEVLSDPRATGTEFVEIYNRSQKVVDLKSIWLATRDKYTGEIASVKETAPDGRLMFPGEYIVLTKDAGVVQSEYFTPNPAAFVNLSSLPSYPNETGTVVLVTPWALVLDEFSYNSEMHFALLNSTDGVSLERINPDRPTGDKGNWHSAAQNVGFATPGYQNSQYLSSPEGSDEVIITPEIFSPDNDGYNDVLSIVCNFIEPGYAATIRIFDSNGRPVRLLVKNEAAGTSNPFTWDGTTDEHEKASIGIYIIHVEIFNMGGKVKEFKKTAVLGSKL